MTGAFWKQNDERKKHKRDKEMSCIKSLNNQWINNQFGLKTQEFGLILTWDCGKYVIFFCPNSSTESLSCCCLGNWSELVIVEFWWNLMGKKKVQYYSSKKFCVWLLMLITVDVLVIPKVVTFFFLVAAFGYLYLYVGTDKRRIFII